MCGRTPGGDDYHALPYLATIRRLFGVTWRGVILADGVYSNNRDTRSMASGEVRARNTLMRRDFPTFPAINKIYLGPGMGFNLGEFELCVVGVHLLDLLSCWSSQHLQNMSSGHRMARIHESWIGRQWHLDNFHELVHSAITRENRLGEEQVRWVCSNNLFLRLIRTSFYLAQHQLSKHATSTPHINVSCVVSCSKNQLRRPEEIRSVPWFRTLGTRPIDHWPVVSWADVGDVGFPSDQVLGAAKVAQLEDSRLRIQQKILMGRGPVDCIQNIKSH